MHRRNFISLLGGAAVTVGVRSLTVQAQTRAMQVIGLLNGQPSASITNQLAAFRQGLTAAGLVEGRNLAIVYRSAEGNPERLPALARELVDIPVSVIAAVGGEPSVLAAKAATATIPIVFETSGDPVENGIVASLNRPGGNVTGATFLGSLVASKQVSLLRDMLPQFDTLGLLLSPTNPSSPAIARDVQEAARPLQLRLVTAAATTERDIETGFEKFVEQRADALIIAAAVFFNRYLDRLVALAARHAIPSISNSREFPAAAGLMSYGADSRDAYRQAGIYVGRILKGEKPGDLPVQQSTKFEFVINLKTAKALNIAIPPGVLAIADEVIE
jgi:putative ABC transport system substrate-binding protein